MMLRRAAAVFAVIGLSGCAVTDHFDDRVDRFNVAAEQARDQIILINVVRASRAEPIAFLNLGQISGTTQVTGAAGLPGFVLGSLSPVAATATLQKDLIFGGSAGGGQGFTGNSTSIQGSTGIQATPAETKDFYTGLLTEVSPLTLQFFSEQGISRELLFYLFTSAVYENGREVQNDPLSPQNFQEFQTVVQAAMVSGLSAELVPQKSGGKTDKNAKAPTQTTQLCFDKSLMTVKSSMRLSPICGAHQVSPDPRTVMYGDKRVTVVPRSVFGIFQFLGKLLASGRKVQLQSADAIGEGSQQDPYLFDVETGFSGPCFLSVSYEGNSYCIPVNGAANTKRIISMLTQLIALNTSIQDIPITNNVSVVP